MLILFQTGTPAGDFLRKGNWCGILQVCSATLYNAGVFRFQPGKCSTQLFNGMTVSIILNFFLEKLSQYWLCLSVVVSMITIVALGSEIKEIVYFLILGHQISN